MSKGEREALGLWSIPASISLLSTPPRRRLLLLLTLSKASQLVPTCRSWAHSLSPALPAAVPQGHLPVPGFSLAPMAPP